MACFFSWQFSFKGELIFMSPFKARVTGEEDRNTGVGFSYGWRAGPVVVTMAWMSSHFTLERIYEKP